MNEQEDKEIIAKENKVYWVAIILLFISAVCIFVFARHGLWVILAIIDIVVAITIPTFYAVTHFKVSRKR